MAECAEEARVELALGRQPNPGAVAAERLGHRRDQAALTLAIDVAPSLRDLAAVAGIDRFEGPFPPDDLHHLGSRHDLVQAPAIRRSDVHVLDEAEDVTGMAGPSGERQDPAVV